ncbi:hypothetical protein WMF18_12775 [Sorangium sp. So ce315]|uniref:hypothetical protein n=1 Tax=Sorangium sp. So ce315 TaxID=3133299 RepID=UPI003F616F35
MRDFLRFFLSAADQARVDPASVTVGDVPPGVVPDGYLYAPQALQINFRIKDPAAGAPRLLPLFPGAVRWLAEPGTPGDLPEPAAVDVTPAGVATWRTLGTLQVKVTQAAVEAGIREHGPGLEVQPNIAWYAPVQLSEQFLLTTLVGGLAKANIKSASAVIRPANAEWPKHAISRFLQGVYTPELRLGATAAADDVVAHAMPTVVMAADGAVTLTISIARTQPPQDGDAAQLDVLAPGLDRQHPLHPINGRMPARHAYRMLRPHLLGAAAADPLADLVLAPWPQARRYFAIKFTRTWQDVPNFSVLFPSRSAVILVEPAFSHTLEIPAHGVVYVPQNPAEDVGAEPPMQLFTVNGPPSTWMAGRPDAWRVRSATTPIPLATAFATQVILRRPLREEILADPVFPAPGGMRCTYMSLRRATRAFVDHRLTGGRLTHERASTSSVTTGLMTAAWDAAHAALLTNNRPLPEASPGKARDLEKIWRKVFPDTVPAWDVDGTGSLDRAVEFDGGQMMYALWQTIESVLAANGTKRNFSNDHVGCGASGAIVAVGLAADYLVKPPHDNPDPAVLDANVADMLSVPTPGCVLQFWKRRDDYQRERERNGPPVDYGHSPIFRTFMPPGPGGAPTGIIVVDQFGGNSQCPFVGGRIKWGAHEQEIWIAAQWDD